MTAAVAIAAGLPAPRAAADDGVVAAAYLPVVRAFLAQGVDVSQSGRVEGLTLARSTAEFRMERGVVTLATPVGGRVHGAVFAGEGVLRFAPPSAVERREVARFLGAEEVERPFRELVLLFADSTEGELRRSVTFGARAEAGTAGERLREYLDLVGDRDGWLTSGLAKTVLQGGTERLFFAYVVCADGERLFFEIHPGLREDATFWRVPRSMTGRWSLEDRDLVSQFRTDAAEPADEGDTRRDMNLRHVALDVRISSTLRFDATADLAVTFLRAGPVWTPLQIFSDLEIDSVAWGGQPATYHRLRRSPTLWVRTPEDATEGATAQLRIAYRGAPIHSAGDWLSLRSSTGWYPWVTGDRQATFDLTIQSPAKFHVSASGEELERRERQGVLRTRWAVRTPSRNLTFVIGPFEERAFAAGDGAAVRGLMYRGRPERVVWKSDDMSIEMGSRLEDWVVEDAARCFAFFGSRFGTPPLAEVRVAQIPALHGEAFPGLINIPETAFAGEGGVAEDQVFRSHEVAHQWWGYGVGMESYHDHWLIEGFANFAGLWYLQEGLGRQRDYLVVLGRWRDRLLDDRRTRPDGGRQPGPVWLGYRNSTSARPRDYVLIDYLKGAWVLHMLRGMLLDLRTMDDGGFARIMQEFYAAHRGGFAATEDFIRIAESVTGQDLGWFFEQWIYRAEIPTYRVAHRTDRTADGRWVVRLRVAQERVPPEFQMPVTIRLDFGGDRFAWVRRVVTGAVSEFELPPVDFEPRQVLFNDVASVLAEVKREPW